MSESEAQRQFRDLVQAALRQARRKAEGGRFTQQDLAAAVGMTAREFSARLNRSRGRGLPASVVRKLVATLIGQGAIASRTQAQELLQLGGASLPDEAWQRPPYSLLEATTPMPPTAAAPTALRSAFQARLRELYRRADPYADGHHPRQQDLAHAIGLAPTELSRRLNGLGKAALTAADVRAIVRTLVEWQAITSRAEADELLAMGAAPSFSTAEWASPPLDLLNTSSSATPPADATLTPHNLPRAITSFVGRQRELDDCATLVLAQPLVTICGLGGIGKTRFSLELAARLVSHFPAGIYFVELVGVTEPLLLGQAVAKTLGLREESDKSVTEQMVAHLTDKRLLLVLDNCEQASAAIAALVTQLLTRCPQLTIVATSREGLGSGETLFPLGPLALPPRQLDPVALSKAEAVQLFIARARAVRPDFALTAQNAAHVGAIVNRLEGMPLAIELAAPMLQVLSTSQLAARLEERLRWLVSSSPALPPRQRTLTASIQWSYDLLQPDEQRLFRRLSVFSGGWELSAAEAICAEDAPSESWVLQVLARLVRASLVQTEAQADGEMRYNWLVAVREFAANQLEGSGEAETIARRHTYLYLTLVEQLEPQLIGPNQAQALARLDRELDNFRAALGWALQQDTADVAQRIAGALHHFWADRAYLAEGRSWLTQTLALPSAEIANRAQALHVLGLLAKAQTDLAEADACFTEALALYRQLGEHERVAAVLRNWANVYVNQGKMAEAQQNWLESLAISRELGNLYGTIATLNDLGAVESNEGNFAAAQVYFEEAVALARQLNSERELALGLGNLALVLYRQGDTISALQMTKEVLALFAHIGARSDYALAQVNIGDILRTQGDGDGAETYYCESMATFSAIGAKEMLAYLLERFAGLAADRRQGERATRLFGAAAHLRQVIDCQLPPFEQEEVDRDIATARALISEAEFAASLQQGMAMSLEQAVQHALDTPAEVSV